MTVATEPRTAAKTKVLHLLPDVQVGGGQTVVLNQLLATDRDRFEVRVAALDARGTVGDDLAAASGAPVLDLGVRRAADVPKAVWRLAAKLRDDDVAILHVHSDRDRKIGQAAALLARVPVVGHLHAEWIHLGAMPPRGSSPIARAKAKVVGAVRDGIERRTVCHYVATSAHVRGLFHPLVRQPITVAQQSIAADRFTPDPARRSAQRAELGLADDAPVLVCVSRLVDGKGHEVLLRALRDLRADRPTITLLLVGDGPRRGELEALAEELGVADAVRFLGERADVTAVLAAADVFVFASENEGFGLAVLEAMAASLPVVAVHCDSLAGFVEPDTGTLTPRDDLAAFTREIDALLAAPDRAVEQGRAGRRLVLERFSADAAARSIEAVYDEVLGTPVGSPATVTAGRGRRSRG